MKPFTYYQPTEIRFGRGRLEEAGEVAGRFGKRCLIVSTPVNAVFKPMIDRVKCSLKKAGVECAHFDGVVPNPTTDCVTAGAKMAKSFEADVILGIGGGSSMDTAKAISVEATHPGTAWDYLYFKTSPTSNTLPIIAVSTTSGTGSQVTQVAVMTETKTKTKSAIYNAIIYPKVAIIDPDLMETLPPHITASTGFDAFCHAFESYLHPSSSPYTEHMALEAMALVVKYLPEIVAGSEDKEGREALAWADTLAGLCIANAGVTLPHGIGMTISGHCPQIMHGESLAVIYPEFTRFTYPFAISQFAAMGRIFDSNLKTLPDMQAAAQSCQAMDTFLKEIGMWLNLKDLGATIEDVSAIADNSRVLPDYLNNPKIASRDEIFDMLMAGYLRT
ncbi:MAG: iron-containing alcohol dehydrogenase [Anaerolineaceae bacterium]|nr:iron-containing alcohol dehydrogenase [Anaerolineaceae bacterium]